MNTDASRDIERLHLPATGGLIGRQDAKDQLTRIVDVGDLTVIGIVAPAGIGKSALVADWLRQSIDSFRFTWTYAWHFNDPDLDASANSHDFFLNILQFVGYSSEQFVVASGTEEALSDEKMARLLLSRFLGARALLVLDGVEVLQYSDGERRGQFFDNAVSSLLSGVARVTKEGSCLIIVTSQIPLVDLAALPGYQEIRLRPLTTEEGVKVLSRLGVPGSAADLKDTSVEYEGNALALVLLGKMLSTKFPGEDVTKRHSLAAPEGPTSHLLAPRHVARAFEVLDYFEHCVRARPEHTLLRLMSLVHRPLERDERDYLLRTADVAEQVRSLSNDEWALVDKQLESYGLLLEESQDHRSKWNCNPLVREYFREEFKVHDPTSWRQAHKMLFDYFEKLPVVTRPTNVTELAPLYRAVHHACWAGEFASALRVYQERIMGGKIAARSTNQLGAAGVDAALLSRFFGPRSTEPLPGACATLNMEEQAWLQARAAFCLTCQGRLGEAIEHRKKELEYCEQQGCMSNGTGPTEQEARRNAANAAAYLSELYVLVGELDKAMERAMSAIDLADQSGDRGQMMRSRCRLAAVYHMQGDLERPKRLFDEAMALQRAIEPTKPALYSDHGFLYRKWLLETVEKPEELESFLHIAEQALDEDGRDPRTPWVLAIGLAYLSKACALALLARLGRHSWSAAQNEFERALSKLTGSGSVVYFPEFFLSRARLMRGRRSSEETLKDVEEALRYSEGYRMPLFTAEAYLLRGDLAVEAGQVQEAKGCLDRAEVIIMDRFPLRRAELELLRAQLQFLEADFEPACGHVRAAWGLATIRGQRALAGRVFEIAVKVGVNLTI